MYKDDLVGRGGIFFVTLVLVVLDDPQRLFDEEEVVLDHLRPILYVSDFLRHHTPSDTTDTTDTTTGWANSTKVQTFNFVLALSAMPPHCLVVLARALVLFRSVLLWLSSAASLAWMVVMR
jgi:hypothetical protein